jgi:glycosyltransferase involved in cell wall biosynthesis
MSSIDVIVPCYRYGRFLKECLESVLTQDTRNVRVLIIDDASPDNTAEIAADLANRDSRVTSLRHTKNHGHIATYNEGIEWAAADYLLLLSADDYLLPGALDRGITLLERYSEASFTFGNAVEMDEYGIRTFTNNIHFRNGSHIYSGDEFIRNSGGGNLVTTATAIVRTSLQKRVGGYRAELPHSGDMEMWLRLAACGSVGYIPTPQAVYRRHANNMSLAYRADGFLPDMSQRKAALDSFFRANYNILPNAALLRQEAYLNLSRATLGLASSAFDQGEIKIAERLRELALLMCPLVRRSTSWAKLACRERLGYETWLTLQPIVKCVRWAGVSL